MLEHSSASSAFSLELGPRASERDATPIVFCSFDNDPAMSCYDMYYMTAGEALCARSVPNIDRPETLTADCGPLANYIQNMYLRVRRGNGALGGSVRCKTTAVERGYAVAVAVAQVYERGARREDNVIYSCIATAHRGRGELCGLHIATSTRHPAFDILTHTHP